MKKPQRKRVVSETFEGYLADGAKGPYVVRRINQWVEEGFVRVRDERFHPGDRVRVEVTKLERGK